MLGVGVNGCYGNSHLQRCSSDSRCGIFDDRNVNSANPGGNNSMRTSDRLQSLTVGFICYD